MDHLIITGLSNYFTLIIHQKKGNLNIYKKKVCKYLMYFYAKKELKLVILI